MFNVINLIRVFVIVILLRLYIIIKQMVLDADPLPTVDTNQPLPVPTQYAYILEAQDASGSTVLVAYGISPTPSALHPPTEPSIIYKPSMGADWPHRLTTITNPQPLLDWRTVMPG